ncbi:MAG TPA: hypothetical protein VF386_11740 [Usitatibacter sp.]
MPMRKARWREELDAATTEKDVINVVRDYVALLSRDDLRALPGGSRPGLIATAEEIAEWAVKLVREQLALVAASEGVEAMREMCEFFAAAAAKVTEIRIASMGRPTET